MAAAAVWALEQPLDKLLLDCEHDDVQFLGKAVTRGPAAYPVGMAMHLGNGAVFGALYSNFAGAIPLPRPLRGPAVALSEYLALWPLGFLSDRFHPARKELPQLKGNRRAFAQGAVRHVLFGVTLGELERRLNAAPEPAPPPPAIDVSSNGHGSIERAATGEPASGESLR
jgi:hypothetical protein